MKKAELFQQLIQSTGKLSKARLEQLYEIIELFRRAADPQDYKEVTDAEWEKISLIGCILCLYDVGHLRGLRAIASQMEKKEA